jgi:hypothetical protein
MQCSNGIQGIYTELQVILAVISWYLVSRSFGSDQLGFKQCSAGIQVIRTVLSWYSGHSDSAQLVFRSFRQCSAGIQVIQAVISWYPGHSGSDQLVYRPFRQ